jgi:MFS superfamily sulfate permease-like transporter
MSFQTDLVKNLKYDLPASLTVFLVALPLCLGIALASGAPMFSGLIAGVVGGVVVGFFSGSNLSVSGPAAGLTTIVLSSIQELNSFQVFLAAVVMAGFLQLILGYLKAGTIGHFFPSAVIKGMLAAIGLILILKQIPHALGYDRDFEGDESFFQDDGENTFTEIIASFDYMSTGAIAISAVSFVILLLWDKLPLKKLGPLQFIPPSLLVVITGIVINQLFILYAPDVAIQQEHLVSVSLGETSFQFPDWSGLSNPQIYVVAVTIALVASLESLLSIEATDKLDPYKHITPLNRELKAQGIGNMVSGLLGGLPVTAVIVRSSANVTAGARTKVSTIVHGILLATAVISIPSLLNMIPLSCLAAILITIGYKLASPTQFKKLFKQGYDQFIPFVVTILAILFSNLLLGIGIGICVGLLFVLKTNYQQDITIVNDGDNYLLKLTKDVSFLNKAILRKTLQSIPENSYVLIDGSQAQFVDHDIIDTLEDFVSSAPNRNIDVEVKKIVSAPHEFFRKN